MFAIRRSPARRALAALALLAALGPRPARAQGADDKAAAQALFEDGRQLMEQGRFAEACKKLEGSQKLDPGAGTLLNLAACYEKNGQTASAWVTYKDAATAAAERHPDWAERATKRAAELAPVLSRLTIVVVQSAPGLEVKRDGVVVAAGTFGAALPLDPGAHTVEASAPGHVPFRAAVTIGARADAKTVHVPALAELPKPVAAAPIPAGTAPPPRAVSPGRRTQVLVGATVAGLGVIGAGVGAAFGVIALGKKGDASGHCSDDFARCNAAGISEVHDARSAGTISTVGFVAGGALATAGLVLVLTAPRGESDAPAAVGAGGGTTLHAAAGAPSAPAGLSFGGAF